MATYFQGSSEIQADNGLQTLVLMNPSYIQYSDTPPPQQPLSYANNHIFLASAPTNTSLPPQTLSHAPPAQMQQFVGIPMRTSTTRDPNHPSVHTQLDVAALHGFGPGLQYNHWNTVDRNMASRDTPRAQQGLCLSLSSQQTGYGSFGVDREMLQANGPVISGDDVRVVSGATSSSTSGVTNGVSGMQGVLLSSNYLKPAQELLDEVVNVKNDNFATKTELVKKTNLQNKETGESSMAASGDCSTGVEASLKRGSELSTAERQEIQMKKAKLVNMLDEVEQRYRQYHHQMMIVISSFEEAAGIGSARTYTDLALQTISKQFRCLKDAITGQIRAADKNLEEEDCLDGRIEGSRLKFVDNHLRQQRGLQQMGMIQQNPWRPQRGLPERSVSVLRAWLFEHFLHPYPKDSDKHILAKQTGLSRSQVSNWFINARVRLWKPMVEDMYLEEIKEKEKSGSEDKTSNASQDEMGLSVTDNQPRSFNSKHDNSTHNKSPTTCSVPRASTSKLPIGVNARNQSGFSLTYSSELDGMNQGSFKKRKNLEMLHSTNNVDPASLNMKSTDSGDDESMTIKFGDERQSRGSYSYVGGQTNFIGGFGQYPIGEFGRFDAEQFTPSFSGNGVSLTLGLPHCDQLSLSGTHQTFLPNQNIQLGQTVDISEPNEFGAISTSTPSFISI